MTDKPKPGRLPSKRGFRATALIAVSLVLIFILIGWEVGHALSPKSDTEQAPKDFIATHLKIDRLTAADVWLSVRAGDSDFAYQLSRDAVRATLLPANSAPKVRRIRRNILKEHDRLIVLASMAAPSAAKTFGKVARLAKSGSPRRRAVFAAAGLVAVGGGAIGFYFGYDESIDFDAPAFASGMRRKEVWRGFAVALQKCFIARGAQIGKSGGSGERTPDPGDADAEGQRITTDCARTVLGYETR